MKRKSPKALFTGSIGSAVLAVVMLICRIVLGAEASTIKNGHALFVVSGSKEMTRSGYLAYAAKINSALTILLIVFALAAVGLFAMYQKSKKQ